MSLLHSLRLLGLTALLLSLAAPARAGDPDEPDVPEAKAPLPPRPATPEGAPLRARRPPETAAAALVRAAAAYEYGDMNQIVESTRPVTEGYLVATNEEQAEAYRYLGIGLFLTDRLAGAEHAFNELLDRLPNARLDPTTTRPELVAFFENVRRQRLNRQLSARRYAYNFLPPLGQFQNGDRTTGWILLAVEGTSLAAFLTTGILLQGGFWLNADRTPNGVSYDVANTARTVNLVSAGVFAASFLYGVVDGLVGYSRPIHPRSLSARLHPTPNGFGITF